MVFAIVLDQRKVFDTFDRFNVFNEGKVVIFHKDFKMCIRDSADTMRIIILPQAVRTILPPLTNQVVNLIKNTSTVAIISGADIMFTAKAWAYDTTNYVPAFAGAAFLYFIMCFPLATWARRKEEENKKAY